MTGNRITDKHLVNKRFRQTEEKILLAFSTLKERLSVMRLIKLAGISRSTLYRHHKTISEIAPDYEHYILKKHKTIIKRLMKNKKVRLKSLYERTLIFMIAHQKIIKFLIEHGNKDFLEKMLTNLEPKTISTGKITNSEMSIIYTRETSAVVEKWLQDSFDKNEIATTVNKIMYLANNAQTRLGPITKESSSRKRTSVV